MRDRQNEIAERFDARVRRRVLAMVSDELIREHARHPRGPHSADLHQILRYLRRAPLPHSYVVVAVEPWRDYRVGTLEPLEKDPSQLAPRIDEESFGSDLEAMQEVFIRRLHDLERIDSSNADRFGSYRLRPTKRVRTA